MENGPLLSRTGGHCCPPVSGHNNAYNGHRQSWLVRDSPVIFSGRGSPRPSDRLRFENWCPAFRCFTINIYGGRLYMVIVDQICKENFFVSTVSTKIAATSTTSTASTASTTRTRTAAAVLARQLRPQIFPSRVHQKPWITSSCLQHRRHRRPQGNVPAGAAAYHAPRNLQPHDLHRDQTVAYKPSSPTAIPANGAVRKPTKTAPRKSDEQHQRLHTWDPRPPSPCHQETPSHTDSKASCPPSVSTPSPPLVVPAPRLVCKPRRLSRFDSEQRLRLALKQHQARKHSSLARP